MPADLMKVMAARWAWCRSRYARDLDLPALGLGELHKIRDGRRAERRRGDQREHRFGREPDRPEIPERIDAEVRRDMPRDRNEMSTASSV